MANTPIRDAKRVVTRAKIDDAAKAVFKELGYEAATIRKIAAVAGLSTGAIYANWPDKEALFRHLLQAAPPVDGALWRAAPGMLSVLQALQSADDADKAQGFPSMAGPRRSAIDAIVASAKTPLPFEVQS